MSFEMVLKGGWITWVILLGGLGAMVIIVERLLHFHRCQINVPEFMRGVINVLKRGNALEAISICDDTPGPVAYIMRAAIMHCDRGEHDMKKAVEEASMYEVPRLERSITALGTIATMAPLAGLLGTVIGMITTFQNMANAGSSFIPAQELADGIWVALISTAAGLLVGIPAQGFYNYFVRRVDHVALDMEKAASELIFFLCENPVKLENADARSSGVDDEANSTSVGSPVSPVDDDEES